MGMDEDRLHGLDALRGIAALIVVAGWILTGVYVSRANGEFDSITAEVLKEARK